MSRHSLLAVADDGNDTPPAARPLHAPDAHPDDFFENGLVALQWTGADGKILRANQAQLDLLGYARKDYVGHDMMEFCLDPQLFQDLLVRAGAGETIRDQELCLRSQDGAAKYVMLSMNATCEQGRGVHARSVMRDITQRKGLEEELCKRAQEWAEADRRKDEFMALLAHELRNPLAPVRNALHLLCQRGTDERTRRWVQDILVRQVEQMSRILDDLLDIARVTRGGMQLQRTRLDLVSLVRTAAEDHRAIFDQAALHFEIDLPDQPLWVLAERPRLSQVVGNLLQNAAKFTDPGGRVTVRLTCAPERGLATMTVADTGIGIPPQQLNDIFQAFFQADRSLERSRGGLGLGLALVKAIVELHGGGVRASSEGPGRGTAITFWVPLEQEENVPAPAPGQPDPATRPLRIVIVEDNPDTGETLRALLELSGHEARVTRSGPAGVEATQRWQPDVVLCDIGLPGMDGYAVARTIRQDPAIPRTSLIALSGYGSEADKSRCYEAGFQLHLTKPVDPAELERALASVPLTR